ncbi:penicillin-binding protein 1C [Desulfonatronum sp. SC1]|nr:penicillin-binding protein 1C [Desulfonatronum sp. SC1]
MLPRTRHPLFLGLPLGLSLGLSLGLFAALICAVLWNLSLALFLMLDAALPLRLPEEQGRDFAQLVADAQGRPLRAFPDADGVWRYPVAPEDVSPLYLTALLAYEDRWFFHHPGVNPLALLRALGQWGRYGRVVSGGSTLTMQVARILHPHPRSLAGKTGQMFRALQLERRFSKDEILTLYLNHAPFGGTLEGVQAASYAYLEKPASSLTHAEAALLAVLPQRPSALRPDRHPERAVQARDKVLQRLARTGQWSAREIDEARMEPVLAGFEARPLLAPLLADRLRAAHPDRTVIATFVDSGLQAAVQDLAADHISGFPPGTSAAALIVNNADLAVLAYIGAARYGDETSAGFVDMVQAVRSPGSALKPFIYGLALDEGLVHAESLLLDAPLAFDGYRPQNFDARFLGPVSLSEALQRSLNVPAVQILAELGPGRWFARLQHAGLDVRLPARAQPNLSMALGGVGVRLDHLAGVYAALGRDGMAGRIRFTPDEPLAERRLMSPEAAWIIHHVLRVPLEQSGELHRLTRTRLPTVAHKTGTSFGHRDAWAVAVTATHTVAVWIGRPDGAALAHNTGRVSAVPLLHRLLLLLPPESWQPPPRPANVMSAAICWPQGTLASLQSPEDCHRRRQAWLIDQTAPPTLRDPLLAPGETLRQQARSSPDADHGSAAREPQTIQLWPPTLEPWLPERWQRASLLPRFDPLQARPESPRGRLLVQGIQPNAVLSPLPSRSSMPDLHLSAIGVQGEAHWFLNGIWQGQTSGQGPEHHWTLSAPGPGEQRLAVMDQAGKFEQVSFRVLER